MLQSLFNALIVAAALLPADAASTEKVTWEEVARASLIVIGTPVPFQAEYPFEQAEHSALQVLDIEGAQQLKGSLPDFPLWIYLARDEHIVLNRAYVFLLSTPYADGAVIGFVATTGAAELVSRRSPRGVRILPQWNPMPLTELLRQRIERLLAENEHYRMIGAAYRPDPNDPLLAIIQEDLKAIARPKDRYIQQERVRQLLERGNDIVPLLISLIDDRSRFPYGELTIRTGSPGEAGNGTIVSFPHRMTHAISDLLSAKTGIYIGKAVRGGSQAMDQHAIDGWHTYLGRLLTGDLSVSEQ